MKELLLKYKTVLKFILTFLVVYIGLTLVYKWYLGVSDGSKFYPDFFTNLVSRQTKWLLELLGYNIEMIPDSDKPFMNVVLNGRYVARIIEGCSSISVIILFLSFIVAFSGKLKTTIVYLLFGAIGIYVINLFRIVLLTIALYFYPQQEHLLHKVVFPAIIYGLVFLLWFFWVNKFSKNKRVD